MNYKKLLLKIVLLLTISFFSQASSNPTASFELKNFFTYIYHFFKNDKKDIVKPAPITNRIKLVIHGFPGQDMISLSKRGINQKVSFVKDLSFSIAQNSGLRKSQSSRVPHARIISSTEIDFDPIAKDRYRILLAPDQRDPSVWAVSIKDFSFLDSKLANVAMQIANQIQERFLQQDEVLEIDLIGSSLGGIISAFLVEIFAVLKLNIDNLSPEQKSLINPTILNLILEQKESPWIANLKKAILTKKIIIDHIFTISTPTSESRTSLVNSKHWGEMINKHIHIFSSKDLVQIADKLGLSSESNTGRKDHTKRSFPELSLHNKRSQINLTLKTAQGEIKAPGHSGYCQFGGLKNVITLKNVLLNQPTSIFNLTLPGEVVFLNNSVKPIKTLGVAKNISLSEFDFEKLISSEEAEKILNYSEAFEASATAAKPREVQIIIHGYPGQDIDHIKKHFTKKNLFDVKNYKTTISDLAKDGKKGYGQLKASMKDVSSTVFNNHISNRPNLAAKPQVNLLTSKEAEEDSLVNDRLKHLISDGKSLPDAWFVTITNFSFKDDRLAEAAFDLAKKISEQILTEEKPFPIKVDLIGSSLGGVIAANLVEIFSILKQISTDNFSQSHKWNKKIHSLINNNSAALWLEELKTHLSLNKIIFDHIFTISTPTSRYRQNLVSSLHWASVITKHIHIFSEQDKVQLRDKKGLSSGKPTWDKDPSNRAFELEPNHKKRTQLVLELKMKDGSMVSPDHSGYSQLSCMKDIFLIKKLCSKFNSNSILRLTMPGDLIARKTKPGATKAAVVAFKEEKEVQVTTIPENEALSIIEKNSPSS